MSSILLNRPVPLKSVLPGDSYALKESPRPRYAYSNGTRTDSLEGYVYTVVNMTTLDQVSVLVRQTTPVILQEDFEAAQSKNQRVMLTFDNAIIRQYMRRGEGIASPEDSISADGVRVVQNK